MKVDCFDNTLVCEKDDLQYSLSYFKDNRKVPEYVEKAILEYIYKKLKLSYSDNKSINELLENLPNDFIRQSIFEINTMFITPNEVEYKGLHLSYLLYYLPSNIFKIWKPLLDLHLNSLLKPKLSILDIGTGPGSVTIGLIEFYKSLALKYGDISFKLEFTLIDAEESFLDIALFMLKCSEEYLPANLKIEVVNEFCHLISPEYENEELREYDLITMSNFLSINEKSNSTYGQLLISKIIEYLKKNGSIIIIEPADEQNCYSLKQIRNNVLSGSKINLYSPCASIWESKALYNCTCFNMARSYWELPTISKYLSKNGLNKGRRVDVPFSYVILRKDGYKKYEIETNTKHFARLKDLDEHIGKRANIKAIIRSVIENGNRLRILLCDGSCSFNGKEYGIYIDTTSSFLKEHGINVKLIAGEKITLNKIIVRRDNQDIRLDIDNKSILKIDF